MLQTIFMLMAYNPSFILVDYEFPSIRTFRNYLATAREKMEIDIKYVVKNKKKLCLSCDETTGCQKKSILNTSTYNGTSSTVILIFIND